MFSRLRSFLIAWTRRERFEDSLDEEARFHLDAYTEDLVRSGMSRREAVRRARIHFGSVEGMKDDCRQARGLRFADQLGRDMKHAGRFLRRNPGFAAVAAATLGLSIGATVVVFSIMDAWLFRPLNFPEPDRLTISVYATRERPSEPAVFVLYRDYLSWKERSRSFESMSAVFPRTCLMGDVADVTSAAGLVVTGEFFSTLGVSAGLGRTFSETDQSAGAAVAVLSHGLWERRFAASQTVIGTSITLNDVPHEVIGVMPPEFELRMLDRATGYELWTLFRPGEPGYTPGGTGGVAVLGRLRSGASIAATQQELTGIHRDSESVYARNAADFDVLVASLQADNTRTVRLTLVIVAGAVGCLLLIACMNIATLWLGRAPGRTREAAIRVALGAGRLRLVLLGPREHRHVVAWARSGPDARGGDSGSPRGRPPASSAVRNRSRVARGGDRSQRGAAHRRRPRVVDRVGALDADGVARGPGRDIRRAPRGHGPAGPLACASAERAPGLRCLERNRRRSRPAHRGVRFRRRPSCLLRAAGRAARLPSRRAADHSLGRTIALERPTAVSCKLVPPTTRPHCVSRSRT